MGESIMNDEKSKSEFTFTKSKIEKYDIRWGAGEWAIFSIDEKSGMMQCLSSYGKWSYAWPHHGRKTFKHFLLEMERDWDYLLRKVSDPVFDFDQSVKYWKKHIIDVRRENSCTKEQARDAFDVINDLNIDDAGYCASVLNSSHAIREADPYFWDVLGGVEEYPYEAKTFAQTIWPMLCEVIRGELKENESVETVIE